MSKLSKKIIAVILTTLLLGSSLTAFANDEHDDGWRSTNIVIESRQS